MSALVTAQIAGPEEFATAMRLLPAGVVMVTTRVDGRPWGLTITSCCSVSASPALILISLGAGTSSRASILDERGFGLSFLGAEHRPLAEYGARAGAPKFIDGFLQGRGDGRVRSRRSGAICSPMVDGAIAHLHCALRQSVEVADHTLIVGEVEQVAAATPTAAAAQPLLYFDRGFRRIGSVA